MPGFAGLQKQAVRLASMAAAAMMLAVFAPSQRAQALSPIGPATVPITKPSNDGALVEARFGGGRGGGGGGFRGGGGGGGFRGGFGGGGFRGGLGGGGFRGGYGGGGFRGGFAGGPRFYGGGARFGGGRFYGGGPRFARYGYGYRPGWRRPFYGPRYGFYQPYYGYGFYRPRFCRIVYTYYGPRRICRPYVRPFYRTYYGY